MRDVCFMLLCGIPASGKSTFCEYLNSGEGFLTIYDILNIEYDKLLPPDSNSPREDRRILEKVQYITIDYC